ncbi:MAG: ATP-binding protein [Candidatus Gracilibacteria bacterium]|nr:ATP-binding protein [Candidatus Gracilibacteria bacterium]MDQ7021980.1 ATP-binding protein [Candidatus Gracilibacteria bacterium]
MTYNPKNNGFENFFEALTNTSEFKQVLETSTRIIDKSGENINDGLSKAGDIMSAFNKSFNNPEVKEVGNNLNFSDDTQTEQKTTKSSDKKSDFKVDVKYFENSNPKTFGFLGVAGLEDLKQELKESFINPLKFKFLVEKLDHPQPLLNKERSKNSEKNELYKKLHSAYEKLKVSIPTGLLMYGPPGTGKTFLAKKLAQELGAGFISKSMLELGSSYMHQTTQNIKALFDGAKKASEKGAIILFLDEIDSLVSSRTDRVDANKAEEVSQFLQEFNKLADEAPNLIVIAATNRPDHLDSALLRSGRLDKKIYLGVADFETRKSLFKIFIEKFDRPHTKLDYNKLSELTEGYVAADIENIVKEASRDASQGILDIVNILEEQTGELDFAELNKNLDKHVLNMNILKQAILDTTSSVKMIDMSVYEKWKEKVS